jgi:hypothetical protein
MPPQFSCFHPWRFDVKASFGKIIPGLAGALIGVGAAHAADLPVKAKAVEYVKVCSLYGAGFYYIPGTDTCIKLGGYFRIDTNFNAGLHDQPAYNGDLGQHNRFANYTTARARFAFTVDTRTATEYGLVRTFGQTDLQFSTFGSTTINPAVVTAPGLNSAFLDTPGGGYAAVENLFLQFAGFTFGKSASAYATPWQGFPGNNTSFLLGGQDTATGAPNIQYGAEFANGLSAAVGLDDPTVYNRTSLLNLGVPGGATSAGANTYGGTRAPDVVGRFRSTQSWGMFQLSGGLHEVNASYNALGAGGIPLATSETSGHPGTKWGGSVQAAVQIKDIPTGPSDDIKFDASYSIGDTKRVISTSGPSPSFAIFGGSSVPGTYQSIGFGQTADAVYLPVAAGGTGDIKLATAYGMRGAFNHNWNPVWSTSLFGTYSFLRYGGRISSAPGVFDLTSARGQWCSNYTAGKVVSANYSCNPDFEFAQLGMVTRWTPIAGLAFSAEIFWNHLIQKFTGSAVLAAAAPKPTTFYAFKDQDAISLNIRAQRNF